eukprot:CAMPEP_0197481158 /NCGR_PEP_ID=MMETSP1309-20131121/45698_1 /TAXON_ID=464262 /ORGANISM="Genus nov. species nov., Strain RCC998" /LENGTH=31 /DNA_ID= /DNA_START= /DNA_END= /DNA_ORIENTATION=
MSSLGGAGGATHASPFALPRSLALALGLDTA